MRVHIWRYSVRRECVKRTHSRAHKGPHGAHKPATPPLLQDQSESRSLSDEVRSDPGGVPGLEDVGTHAPVLSVLRLPVTSLVHKVCLSSDWVPPLVKPQRLVAFVFSPCRRKHRCYSISLLVLLALLWRSHTCRQFTEQSIWPSYIWIYMGSNQSVFTSFGMAPNVNWAHVKMNKLNSEASIKYKLAQQVRCENLDRSLWRTRL